MRKSVAARSGLTVALAAALAAALLALVFLAAACRDESWRVGTELRSQSRDGLLGTVVTISCYDEIPDRVFEECFEAVREIDGAMSVHLPDSGISRLNESGAASLPGDTYSLLERALRYSELSGGAFDITIGAVTELWKTGGEFARLPDAEEIAAALPLVGYADVRLNGDGGVDIRGGADISGGAGMGGGADAGYGGARKRIDLGGIAKGFACERAAEILRRRGVRHALLNFGGNIEAVGTKPDGSPWRVGVRNPVIGEEGYICV
ncbi:MAG: FAD:protein FMN transferase, partial [Clostridiales bacterium]|nr:FAD:protein FMN transferase [Clostridiales bacterium]